MSVFFSIIIPTYNRREKLQRCLDALVHQTYKNFEVIICDDGSTDGTDAVVDTFKDKLDIHYAWAKNWGGPAKPRNLGLTIARYEWICYLDSDDSWMPHKLETILPYTLHHDFIHHNLSIESGSEKSEQVFHHCRQLKTPAFDDLFFLPNPILTSSVCVRKSKAAPMTEDKELIGVEDYDCWLKIALKTDSFLYIDKPLGYYCVDGENLHHDYLKSYKGILKILAQYKMHPDYVGAIAQAKRIFFPYLAINNKTEAFKIMFASFSYEIRFLKGVVALVMPLLVLKYIAKKRSL